MGRKRKSGEDYVRLCEMDIQYRVLHSEIYDNEELAMDKLRVG